MKIRFIPPRLQALFFQISKDVLPRNAKQRTDAISPPRTHAREPVASAPPKQMHQHCFRLISRMMPGGNQGVLAHRARRSFQKSISSVSRRRFQGETFPRGISGDILANDVAGRPMRLSESPHEVGVGHRSRAPYPMLKMRNPK